MNMGRKNTILVLAVLVLIGLSGGYIVGGIAPASSALFTHSMLLPIPPSLVSNTAAAALLHWL
jgi:hypothetical protein